MRITLSWPADEFLALPLAKRSRYERKSSSVPVLIDGTEAGRLFMFGTLDLDLPPGATVQAGWRYARSAKVPCERIDPQRPLVFRMHFGFESSWRDRARLIALTLLIFGVIAAAVILLPTRFTDTDAFVWVVALFGMLCLAIDTVRPGGSAVLEQ